MRRLAHLVLGEADFAEALTESEQPTLRQRLLQMRAQLIESLEAGSRSRLRK